MNSRHCPAVSIVICPLFADVEQLCSISRLSEALRRLDSLSSDKAKPQSCPGEELLSEATGCITATVTLASLRPFTYVSPETDSWHVTNVPAMQSDLALAESRTICCSYQLAAYVAPRVDGLRPRDGCHQNRAELRALSYALHRFPIGRSGCSNCILNQLIWQRLCL